MYCHFCRKDNCIDVCHIVKDFEIRARQVKLEDEINIDKKVETLKDKYDLFFS